MKNSLNLIKYLNIYNLITRCGEYQDGKYIYQQVEAWQDFDGYTCFLSFNDVTLTMMFHGRYDVSSPNDMAYHSFIKKLDEI